MDGRVHVISSKSQFDGLLQEAASKAQTVRFASLSGPLQQDTVPRLPNLTLMAVGAAGCR